MGNYCTCPGVKDQSANIDINIKCVDMNMNQKNNNDIKNLENRTIANNNINVNIINNMSNNINENNSINSNSDYNKKDKAFNSNINRNSFSLMQSFNEDKSITPSNNPLDGLVKLIPKNEQ